MQRVALSRLDDSKACICFPAPKRKMSRPLFAIAFGALQNRDEAEDVVQDAFVKAWKSR